METRVAFDAKREFLELGNQKREDRKCATDTLGYVLRARAKQRMSCGKAGIQSARNRIFCLKGSFDENKHVTGETFGVTLIVTYETSDVTLVAQH